MKSEHMALVALCMIIGAIIIVALASASTRWQMTAPEIATVIGASFTALAACGAWWSAASANKQAVLMRRAAEDTLEARRPILDVKMPANDSGIIHTIESTRIRVKMPVSLKNFGLSAASDIRYAFKAKASTAAIDVNGELQALMGSKDRCEESWLLMPQCPEDLEIDMNYEHGHDAAQQTMVFFFIVVEYGTPGSSRRWLSAVSSQFDLAGELGVFSREPIFGWSVCKRYSR